LFIPAKNGKHEHKKTITIGAITNLDKQKGAHLIPDIAAKVLSHINEVDFIVIGAGLNEDTESRLNELRHIVAEKNITKHITFKGYSNHVNNDLQSFDIFIHVTRNEYKEACSRAILEAQASGLPVIAFNNGGNPELIVDQVTGILVPEGDMTKFAEALLHLIRHPEIRQSMGQQARQRVEKYFNVRFNAARTQSLYEELAQNALGD
jgi:glycosyltransferase involved in cell wall biosynthesis